MNYWTESLIRTPIFTVCDLSTGGSLEAWLLGWLNWLRNLTDWKVGDREREREREREIRGGGGGRRESYRVSLCGREKEVE